jgi:hypothetical protein
VALRRLFVRATVFLLFAGLPAAHEIIIGVGFLRLRVAFATRRRRRGVAATARRLDGFGFVRALCFGRERLTAALRRLPPKPALICFAESLRRFVAILLPFPALAGFWMCTSTLEKAT